MVTETGSGFGFPRGRARRSVRFASVLFAARAKFRFNAH